MGRGRSLMIIRETLPLIITTRYIDVELLRWHVPKELLSEHTLYHSLWLLKDLASALV